MGKVIGILNEKGGVGKTTTATTLAYLLSQSNRRTALIDFDGQGHSSMLCGVKKINTLQITISTLLNRIILNEPLPPLDDYIIHCENKINLIPANSQLFILERNLCNVDFREYKLKEYVNTIKEQYDCFCQRKRVAL